MKVSDFFFSSFLTFLLSRSPLMNRTPFHTSSKIGNGLSAHKKLIIRQSSPSGCYRHTHTHARAQPSPSRTIADSPPFRFSLTVAISGWNKKNNNQTVRQWQKKEKLESKVVIVETDCAHRWEREREAVDVCVRKTGRRETHWTVL